MTDRLPYTHRTTTKGRTYWRFRSKETGEVRLPGDYGSPEFCRRYAELEDLRRGVLAAEAGVADAASWSWLIDRYLHSPEYLALADTTQADYAATCALLEVELGPRPYAHTTRAMLKVVRDDFAATPRKAHKVKQMASRLYSWAAEGELVPEGFNPAAGLKRLKRKGGEREITPWSDAEIAWVLAAAPAHVATPVLLALYTGQRREDVVSMTWQQWQGDLIRVRTSKTRQLLEIPCHPVLAAHLEQLRAEARVISLAGPICLTAAGTPFATANALSGAVRRVVEAHARVPNNRSMHGLRYAAAARMEEGGATIAAIEAVLGHRTFRMAMKYASARLRAAQGIAAMKG